MAKFDTGAFAPDIRGSIGGITFTRGVGGIHVMKRKPIPSVSSTPRQTYVRSLLAYLAGLWRGLSDEQRGVWATFAGAHPVPDVFGTDRILPAYSYFIWLNYSHAELDLPLITDAPLAEEIPISPAGMVTADVTHDGFTMRWEVPFLLTVTLDVWKFGPASAGRRPQVGDVRHLCYVDPAFSYTDIDFFCEPGRVSLYCRHIDHVTGMISPFIQIPPVDVV